MVCIVSQLFHLSCCFNLEQNLCQARVSESLGVVGQQANSPSKGKTGQEEITESLPLEEGADIFKSSCVSMETPGKGPAILWGKGGFRPVQTAAKKFSAGGDAKPLSHS